VSIYSEAVLEHFRNPRNTGELPGATAQVEGTNPVCGDVLRLFAVIEQGRIREARFLCRGCTTAIACASWLTENLRGKTPDEAKEVDASAISRALGGLPPATAHGAQLAVDTLKELLAQIKST
jgi:nitrogen fixation NifU-like protein